MRVDICPVTPCPVLPPPSSGATRCPPGSSARRTTISGAGSRRHDLDEIHDAAVKAAIKDQETAGRRHGLRRRAPPGQHDRPLRDPLPGVEIDHTLEGFYYDFYDAVVRGRLPTASLGLVEDFRFLRRFTDRRDEVFGHRPAFAGQAHPEPVLPDRRSPRARDRPHHEPRAPRARRGPGSREIQIDEPYYSGFPEDLPWGVRAINALVEGVDARLSLHVCYGNRYGKPSWEGSYRFLFPAVLEARIHQLTLEFARRGERGSPPLQGLRRAVHARPRRGRREDPRRRDRRASWPSGSATPSRSFPVDRLSVNPDCGLLHLPREVAFAKLGPWWRERGSSGASSGMIPAGSSLRPPNSGPEPPPTRCGTRWRRPLLLRRRARRLGADARGAVARSRVGARSNSSRGRRQRHQLRRRRDGSRSVAGRRRRAGAGYDAQLHLTCVSQDRAGLRKIARRYARAGSTTSSR